MVNVLGAQVYTAQEINDMIKQNNGFEIVAELPPVLQANPAIVYYKTTNSEVTEVKGYRRPAASDSTTDLRDTPDEEYSVPVLLYRPALIPYVVGNGADGKRRWCTYNTTSLQAPISDEEILDIWNKYDFNVKAMPYQKHLAMVD